MSENTSEKFDQDRENMGKIILSSGVSGAAAILALVNPMLGVIAAISAPILTETLAAVTMRRLRAFNAAADEQGFDLDQAVGSGKELSEEKIVLLEESLRIASRTDSATKIAMIVKLLKTGFESKSNEETLVAQRFARTIDRLEETEFRVLFAVGSQAGATTPFGTKKVQEIANIENKSLVAAAIAVLASEGLFRLDNADIDTWSITEFGGHLIADLLDLSSTRRDSPI